MVFCRGVQQVIEPKAKLYKDTGMRGSTPKIVEDGLENKISIHRVTLASKSRRRCIEECNRDKNNGSEKLEQRSEQGTKDNRSDTSDIYAVYETVKHNGLGPVSSKSCVGIAISKQEILQGQPTTSFNILLLPTSVVSRSLKDAKPVGN